MLHLAQVMEARVEWDALVIPCVQTAAKALIGFQQGDMIDRAARDGASGGAPGPDPMITTSAVVGARDGVKPELWRLWRQSSLAPRRRQQL